MIMAGLLVAGLVLLAAAPAQALTFSQSCFTNHPGAVAVADFNEDGKQDVVMARWELAPDGGLIIFTDVDVHLGNGDGTFGAPIPLNGLDAGGTLAVLAADANNDGHMDVVAANTQGTISVFEGNGNGTFSSKKNYGAAGVATAVTAGDFNGDGRMDFATSDGQLTSVSVLLGVGKGGSLKSRVRYDNAFRSRAITTADFDGDGKLDLATANAAASGPGGSTLSIFLGRGDGSFGPYSLVSIPGATGRELMAADFNLDGKMDLVLGTQGFDGSGVLVLLGNGDGTFAPATYTQTSFNGTLFTASLWIGVGDLNADGRPDVVTSNRRTDANFIPLAQEATVLITQPDGSLVIDSNQPTNSGLDLAVADFNGDGLGDIITDDCLLLQSAPSAASLALGLEPSAGGQMRLQLAVSVTPNPWRDRGSAVFTLPQAGRVELGVFDITGRRVLSVANGEWFAAGVHSLPLTKTGSSLAPGVYLCRLQSASGAATQRMVVTSR
jgi:hypothetical protein